MKLSIIVISMMATASTSQQQPIGLQTQAAPDVVCIHVLTPGVIRRRNGEVNHT